MKKALRASLMFFMLSFMTACAADTCDIEIPPCGLSFFHIERPNGVVDALTFSNHRKFLYMSQKVQNCKKALLVDVRAFDLANCY